MDQGPWTLRPDLMLEFSDDGSLLQANILPAESREPVSYEWLREQLSEHGLDKLRLEHGALAQLLTKYNEDESSLIIKIGERVNGEFSVSLSDDDMQAFFSCSPPEGGKPLSSQQVLDHLGQKGITIGINKQAIDDALKAGESHNVVIAEGVLAKDGVDGYFEKVIEDIRDRRPRIDDDGRAHYNDIVQFVTVKEGEPLVRRILATDGNNGQTVKGETLLPTPGESAMFAASLQGTCQADDDPNLLIAKIAGQPVFVENGAIVEPTISVENVDKKTGNIEFDGSVMVTGNVTTGMRIDADGDVLINGMIEEASCINAGGDIIVQKGIIGRGSITEDNGRPGPGIVQLTSRGTISARFIENTIAEAGHSVEVGELVAHSDITAKHAVRVGKKGAKRGHIMGGVTRAEDHIRAEVLGSQACVYTEIIVGNNPQYTAALLKTRQALETRGAERKGLEIALSRALRESSPKNVEIRKRLKKTIQQLSDDMNRLTALKRKQKAGLEHLRKAEVVFKKKAYNAVDITVANFHERLTEEKNGGTYKISGNALGFDFI